MNWSAFFEKFLKKKTSIHPPLLLCFFLPLFFIKKTRRNKKCRPPFFSKKDLRFSAKQMDTRFSAKQMDTRFSAKQMDTRFSAKQMDTRQFDFVECKAGVDVHPPSTLWRSGLLRLRRVPGQSPGTRRSRSNADVFF